MFGPCRVCIEKELRIHDLKAEIAHLRSMVSSPTSSNSTPFHLFEADKVLSGSEEQTEVMTVGDMVALTEEEQEILLERDRLLSGTY